MSVTPATRARPSIVGAGLYWLYVLVVSAVLVPILLSFSDLTGPDEGFALLLVYSAPVFLIPTIRVLSRIGRPVGVWFLGACVLTFAVPYAVAGGGEISDAGLARAAWVWSALVVLGIAGVTRQTRTGTRAADRPAVAGLGTAALLGVHLGTLALCIAVSERLARRGPSETGFFGDVYYAKHGDWRLALPFAVGSLLAFAAALAVDIRSARGSSTTTLRFLVGGALATVALCGVVVAAGLALDWWSVPFGSPDNLRDYSYRAAWWLVPLYLAALVAVAIDWRGSGARERGAASR